MLSGLEWSELHQCHYMRFMDINDIDLAKRTSTWSEHSGVRP